MIYHETRSSYKRIISSEEIETVMFGNPNFVLEDSIPIFSHDSLAHNDLMHHHTKFENKRLIDSSDLFWTKPDTWTYGYGNPTIQVSPHTYTLLWGEGGNKNQTRPPHKT